MKFLLKVLILSASCCLAAQAAPLPQEWTDAARAGEISQIEERVARLALDKSHDPAVLENARQTVAENQSLFHRLAILAEERQMPMPSGPDSAQEAAFQDLVGMSEVSFDAAYWEQQAVAATKLHLLCVSSQTGEPALKGILAEYATSSAREVEAAGR